jgi:lipopolysaccharide export system permease protein
LNVRRYFPNRYENEAVPEFILPLSGDADQLRLVQGNAKPQHLSIWDLGGAIDSLKSAGSNVESLRTAWHAKAAYAASIVIMSMLAMALVRINENIYAACGLALLVTFSYYMIYTIGLSMGQKGLMPAFWAAWLANFMAAGVTLAVLGPDMLSHKIQTLLK